MSNRKNNVDLICDVAELAGMFEKSSSLTTFLDSTVGMVAWHMKAAVCSIYLVAEGSDELVLSATQGLSSDAVGTLKLKIGEGITGRAVKELRAIREGRGSTNLSFKYIPGIHEDKYEAFLAVPIVRGVVRIGALVVQDPEPDYFTKNDEKALKAITGQLATTIENARLLLSLRDTEEPSGDVPSFGDLPEFIQGQSTSDGIAIGQTTIIIQQPLNLSEYGHILNETISIDRFNQALLETEKELEALQTALGTEHEDIAGLIFSAHLLMLKDDGFSGAMVNSMIDGVPAVQAVMETVNSYVDLFSKSNNPRLQEKVQDVLDLGHRLLLNLQSEDREVHDYKGQVIIAKDLMPSDVVRFAVQRAEGIVLLRRGLTSHISILARSMQIPMIQTDKVSLEHVKDGTPIILDASQGTVFINPGDEARIRYENLIETSENLESIASQMDSETFSTDGIKISILSNINILSDLDIARTLKAEGVGLYRSEFPFIIRDSFPTEEEQCRIYSRVYEKFPQGEITLRTLDIGGDKLASYAQDVEEENPFLGLRGLRYSLRHPEIFKQQLRAMLRAGHERKVKILFPLVSSTDEFLQASEIVQECITELQNEEHTFNDSPELGVMIELPCAVEMVNELAAISDFLSIGSNDLTQYMLAVDRTNDQVSHMYLEHHPAVLRALDRISRAGVRYGKAVSICGEMATRPEMIPFLLGIGIRNISVNPRSMPSVHTQIKSLSIADAELHARNLLSQGSVKDVEAHLSDVSLLVSDDIE